MTEKEQQDERRSLRVDTRPAVTAQQLAELRADDIPWSALEQRFQRNRETLSFIMTGKKKKSRAKRKAARRG